MRNRGLSVMILDRKIYQRLDFIKTNALIFTNALKDEFKINQRLDTSNL